MAIVNGKSVRVIDYQKRLRFWASNYNSTAGPEPLARLDEEQKTGFYEQVADQLIQEAIIEQEAAKNDVSVSDDEIEIEIEEKWFGHFRTPPTPTPSPTPDPRSHAHHRRNPFADSHAGYTGSVSRAVRRVCRERAQTRQGQRSRFPSYWSGLAAS